MNYALRTIAYFLIWGTFYGLVLGTLSGTAILPAIGTAMAALWGTGIGAACGLLVGLGTALLQAYTFHPDIDIDRYRRRLSLGIGIFTPIAAASVLIATSEGTLWDMGIVRHPAYGAPFLPFCLIAVTLWSSLSAAYVASAYPEWLVQLKTGQESTLLSWPSFSSPVPRLMITLYRRALNWWTPILGGIAGLLYEFFVITGGDSIVQIIAKVTFGVVASPIIALLLSFGNAALLTFLRKTVLAEDVISVSPRKLRWTLTIIAFVFTGISSAWTLIFAPLCALLMAMYVYDAFPLLDEDFDKAKRKEKNALAPDEAQQTEGEILMAQDHLLASQKS